MVDVTGSFTSVQHVIVSQTLKDSLASVTPRPLLQFCAINQSRKFHMKSKLVACHVKGSMGESGASNLMAISADNSTAECFLPFVLVNNSKLGVSPYHTAMKLGAVPLVCKFIR